MNFYEKLGVSQQANNDDIKKAYQKLAFQYHPDRNFDNPEACETFKQIIEAYDTLSDHNKRVKYDLTLTPVPKKKPVEKKKNPYEGLTYADAPQSKLDLWGKPIDQPKDQFKNSVIYEDEDQLDIR